MEQLPHSREQRQGCGEGAASGSLPVKSVVACHPQDEQQARGFVLAKLQEQAVQMGADAASMPARVAKIDRSFPISTPKSWLITSSLVSHANLRRHRLQARPRRRHD